MLNQHTDERVFCSSTLQNGLECVLVHDPSLDSVNLLFGLDGRSVDLPQPLESLDRLAMSACWRGSEHFPGLYTFKEFVTANKILFRNYHAFAAEEQIYAEVPKCALSEFFERLADMLTRPEITPGSIELSEEMHGVAFYETMKNDESRINRIVTHVSLNSVSRMTQLFKRRDLVPRVRDYIARYYCPSKMSLVMAANISLEEMQQIVEQTLGAIPRKPEWEPYICPERALRPANDPRIVLVRGYTRYDTKLLEIDFRMPRGLQISSVLYPAYLLSTSQVGSLQHALRSEGLITELSAEHKTRALDLQLLNISMTLTPEGAANATRILSLCLGYVELMKQTEPSAAIFRRAQKHYASLRKEESGHLCLDRMRCEMLMGASTDDLRFAEVPRTYDAAEIKRCIASLGPSTCLAVVLSNQHTEAPLKADNDYYLQYYADEVKIDPCYEGLVAPKPESLLGGDRTSSTENKLHSLERDVFAEPLNGI